jgi:hypothetical protein
MVDSYPIPCLKRMTESQSRIASANNTTLRWLVIQSWHVRERSKRKMKWFMNHKERSKLLLSFIIVLVFYASLSILIRRELRAVNVSNAYSVNLTDERFSRVLAIAGEYGDYLSEELNKKPIMALSVLKGDGDINSAKTDFYTCDVNCDTRVYCASYLSRSRLCFLSHQQTPNCSFRHYNHLCYRLYQQTPCCSFHVYEEGGRHMGHFH